MEFLLHVFPILFTVIYELNNIKMECIKYHALCCADVSVFRTEIRHIKHKFLPGEVETRLWKFSSLALDSGRWSALLSIHLKHGERTPITHRRGGLSSPSVGLVALEKRIDVVNVGDQGPEPRLRLHCSN
jgi:hypothetical protein